MLLIVKEVPLQEQLEIYTHLPPPCYRFDLPLLAAAVTAQKKEQLAGLEGEIMLARTLSFYLSDDYYFIGGLVLAPESDIDSVIVGATGVWMYESKYWAGRVACKGDSWTHYRQENGTLIHLPAGNPAAQWIRNACLLEGFIRATLPELDETCPQATMVRGAVVFTHPQAHCTFSHPAVPCISLDMMKAAPADPLVSALLPATFPPIPCFTTDHRLTLIQAFLEAHRKLAQPNLFAEARFWSWAKQQNPVPAG